MNSVFNDWHKESLIDGWLQVPWPDNKNGPYLCVDAPFNWPQIDTILTDQFNSKDCK